MSDRHRIKITDIESLDPLWVMHSNFVPRKGDNLALGLDKKIEYRVEKVDVFLEPFTGVEKIIVWVSKL